jgi:addiction module RelE/StbE family toxin
MDYKVILARTALRDLGEIARYIARDNPRAAEKVGFELIEIAESLRVMPLRGFAVKSRPGVRRLLKDPYLVLYRVDETRQVVSVQRFWHAKRDPQAMQTE